MMNFAKLSTAFPSIKLYVFLDTQEHIFKKVFFGKKIKLFGLREFSGENTKIRLIKCYIKQKDSAFFEAQMSEIQKVALIMGYSEYLDYCNKLTSIISN